MSVALVPRPATRRAMRRSPLTPLVAVATAAVITLGLGSAVASLVPSPERDDAAVFAPVRLAAVQIVASR